MITLCNLSDCWDFESLVVEPWHGTHFLGMNIHRRSHEDTHWKTHWESSRRGHSLFDDLWEGFDMFPSFGDFGSTRNLDGFGGIHFGDFQSNSASMYMKETNQRGITLTVFLEFLFVIEEKKKYLIAEEEQWDFVIK